MTRVLSQEAQLRANAARRAGGRLAIAAVLGLAWMLTLLSFWSPGVTGLGILLLLAGVLWGMLSLVAYLVLGAIQPRLAGFGRRARAGWLLSVPLSGLLVMLVLPAFPGGPLLQYVELTVTPLDESNHLAEGAEVWLHELRNGSALVGFAAIEGADEGLVREGMLLAPSGGGASLSWAGWSSGEITLSLLTHPWSGKARVTLNGESQEVDLYSDAWGTRALVFTPQAPPAAAWLSLSLLSPAYLLTFGSLLAGATLLAATWRPRTHEPRPLSWYSYALPCVLVWFVGLLAYWPGIMTNDSIAQWDQMLIGAYSNHHPAIHTLTNWLFTRLWLSPAAVATAQILALAAVFGLTMHELARLGLPRAAQLALTALFACSLVNVTMVITLWKDIPFSIAILALFGASLRTFRTRGAWLTTAGGMAAMALALAVIALYRHNGWPLVVVVLPSLLALGPAVRWHHVARVAAGVLALFLLVNAGLYRLVGVAPADSLTKQVFQLYQIGAVLDAGVELSAQDAALLSEVLPVDEWRDKYSCYSIYSVLYDENFDLQALDRRAAEVDALWLRLVVENPEPVIENAICRSAVVWRVSQPVDGHLNTVGLGQTIVPNTLGLVTAPVLPDLFQLLRRVGRQATTPDWIWLVWRPATYLYLSIFAVVVYSVRLRSPRPLALLVPAVAQSLMLLLLSINQDFRYQYGVYMIGLLAPALLLVGGPEHDELEPLAAPRPRGIASSE